MFRFMLCDHDDAFCRREKNFIERFYGEKGLESEIDICHTGAEVLALGGEISSYDAVFLDVCGENGNGVEIGSWLCHASPKLILVFVADDIRYAPEGYRAGAVRFLIKGADRFRESMEECLHFIWQKTKAEEKGFIVIPEGKIRISVGKLLYVESKAHKIFYHLMNNNDTEQEYALYGKLDEAEQNLREFGFFRVHKSYLVNMNYVQDVKRYQVILLDGTEIQISKSNYKATEKEFIRIRGTF